MRLSKKTAHRAIISLCMFAPIAYLFGTMFFYLNGAHNGLELAEPVYAQEYVSVQDYGGEGSYKWEVPTDVRNDALVVFSGAAYPCSIEYLGQNFTGAGSAGSSSTFISFDLFPNYPSFNGYLRLGYATRGDSSMPWSYSWTNSTYTFYGDMFMFNGYGDLYNLMEVPTAVVPENNSANTDFLFGHMFPQDNFLERVGSNALSSSPVGFAPFATFVSTLDNLVFHGSESSLALMIYGEVYWALHVVLADLVYHVAVFIPNLVNRVFDMFSNKGVNDE